MAEPKQVPVIAPDGTPGYAPAPAVKEIVASGGRVMAPEEAKQAQAKADFEEEYSGPVQGAALPFAAGAARGATLGLSDAALGAFGGENTRRRLRDYQTAAPGMSLAGEAAGVLVPSLLGDEAGYANLPGMIGRAGARVEGAVSSGLGGGLAARGAGVLARGAAEGGAFGVGSAVSESALHDSPLTGEALIGGGVQGALGGMVASGLLHGAGSAIGAARGAFRPKASAYEAIAGREFGEAAPGVGKALAGDAEKVAAHPSDVMFDPATNGGAFRAPGVRAEGQPPPGAFDSAGDAYISATQSGEKQHDLANIWKNRQIAFNDGAERIEGHSRDMQAAITKQQEAAKVTDMATFGDAKTNHMDKLVDRERFGEQADVIKKWMSKAQEDINLMAQDTAVTKLGPAARKEFDGQMARLNKALESGDSLKLFTAADNAKRFLGRQAEFGRRATGLPEAAKTFDALYQGEGGLMRALEDPSWGKASPAQIAVNRATTESIGLGNKFRGSFVEEYGSTAGRPDYRANSEKVSSFLGRLTKAANDGDAQAVTDAIRTRRAFLDATSTNYDHGTPAVKAIAAERSALDSLEQTFAKATKETALINQVKRLQSEEQAQKIGGLIGLATDTFSKPVTTLQRLAQIQQHTQSVLDKIGVGTKKLAGASAAAPAATSAATTTAAKAGAKGFFSMLLERAPRAETVAIAGATVGRREYDKRAQALAALQANPAALTAKVGDALGPFSSAAPKAVAAATGVALNGLNFLASKAPPPRTDRFTLQPQLQPATRVSDSDIAKHTRYIEALDNPSLILDLAHSGRLTPDHVEAVKNGFPQLYDRMRTDLFKELTTSTSPLPYGRRIQLGILLDLPTDQTLAPDFVRDVQATYTASEKAGVEPPPPQLSTLDVSSSLMTSTQSAGAEGKAR